MPEVLKVLKLQANLEVSSNLLKCALWSLTFLVCFLYLRKDY